MRLDRDQAMHKHRVLVDKLRQLGVEPFFSEEVIETLSDRGLRAAVKIEEKELIDATQKLAEE